MECPNCGRWAPADRETGYDADDLCPICKVEGEVMAIVVRPVPPGWKSLREDVRRGGLVYIYPDGTEHHMTKEELHASVHPERD